MCVLLLLVSQCVLFHFLTNSFQFGARTSVSWHEGILDDGSCHFRPVGDFRPERELAAGLIYVLPFS